MTISKDCHITVNLITYNYDMVFITEVCQSFQSVYRPTQPCRIMRITQYKHTTLIITDLLQVIKIHIIVPVFTPPQRIEYYFPMVTFWCQTERMIDRWLDNHLLIRFGKHIYYESDTLNNTRNEA